MRNNIKKGIISISVLLLFALLFSYINIYHGLHQNAYYETDEDDTVSDYAMLETAYNTPVVQEFIADTYYLEGIRYIMIGIPEDCHGQMKVQVTDMNGKLEKECYLNYADVIPGEWQELKLNVRLRKDAGYKFVFSNQDESVTPYLLTGNQEDLSPNLHQLYREDIPESSVLYIDMGFCPEVSQAERFILSLLLFLLTFRGIWLIFAQDMQKSKLSELCPSFLKKTDYACLVGGILGAIGFIILYGYIILNPTYTDWLLEGLDLSQHYLGWKFYRNSAWHFPLGLMDTIAYPNKASVIFTDSIPLFALIFKGIDSIIKLPQDFQYFGIWGFLCMILQGITAAAILKKYLNNMVDIAAGTLFFIFSPVLINRMYYHTSLAAQWMVLLSIYLICSYREIRGKKAIWFCGILGALCAAVHIYFLPMCGIFVLGYAVTRFITDKKTREIIIYPAAFILAAVVVVWIFGGFSKGVDSVSTGLGRYSFNLNEFINPKGYSVFLSDLPTYQHSQREGFAYLGLGILTLVCFSFLHQIVYSCKNGNIKVLFRKITAQKIIITVCCLGLLLLALSPDASFNDKLLYSLPIPGWIEKCWSTFRATGRLIWPVFYFIMLYGICGDKKCISGYFKTVILVGCLCLQMVDLHGIMEKKNEIYSSKIIYDDSAFEERWKDIVQAEDCKHIIFMSEDVVYNQKVLYPIAEYASENDITLSNFYFARSIGDAVEKETKNVIANPEDDCIFVGHTEDVNDYRVYDAQQIRDKKYIEDGIQTY